MRYVECSCSLNSAASYILKELFCFTIETDAVRSVEQSNTLLTSKCLLILVLGRLHQEGRGRHQDIFLLPNASNMITQFFSLNNAHNSPILII